MLDQWKIKAEEKARLLIQLKTSKDDDLADKLIELSDKMQDLKLISLKAKRRTKEQEDKEVFEKRWSTYAQRLVDSHVTLLPEPQTESQLVTMLSACEVMKTKGNRGADYMGALWLTSLGSEAL